mmetsp:Transcript_54934/g.100364  ORF Transcript_54934/g.100364 Transcript_54934/m.100364 type:complete len:387 (-) Transcript_54934:87-1247(-)
MSSCLLCGSYGAQLVESTNVFSCRWCAPKARVLDSEVVKTLQEIDGIPPAFILWSGGRREDSTEGQQKRARLPVPQPAEILPLSAPGLFVGDLDDVKNVHRLRELGIGFVLNLCPERLEGHYADVSIRLAEAGIKQLTWPAQDTWDFDIVTHVAKQGACDFIEVGLRSAGVLVNCWGGVNRNATVALAFLVMKKNIGLVDAIQSTMSQRGTVLTNRTFRLLLVQLALEVGCPLRAAKVNVCTVPTIIPTPNGDDANHCQIQKPRVGFSNDAKGTTGQSFTSRDLDSRLSFDDRSKDWACTDPHKKHRGKGHRDTKKYGYLYSAQSACITCIKHYIESEKIDPWSKSDSQGYSAIDFAEWELGRVKSDEEAAKYRVVLSYLKSLVAQ